MKQAVTDRLPGTLHFLQVVLVETSHPGNIGAVARVMANMGAENLVLVRPLEFPSPVAQARASGADWILEQARICATLDEAVADCDLVLGTTARKRSVDWPSLDPWEVSRGPAPADGRSRIAIVFGRESSGLTNSELDRCNYLMRIPVEDGFSSLNLAAAVTVVLYEARKHALRPDRPEDGTACGELASAGEVAGFYGQLESVLHRVDFLKDNSPVLMRKLYRLFNRAHLTREEVNILRGILSSVRNSTADRRRKP